ncbi:MAG: hypothetical protein EOO65_04915 [Methanosarcinales archaeon]|nr:MAG: hypothetical protein EOO65_04915 [Methanosarcinales archaeon]
MRVRSDARPQPGTARRAKPASTHPLARARVPAELAESLGPYETFAGSPASQGILQFDMWGVKPSSRWDWDGLKARVVKYGLRNSLLLAPMPTASTAQILGNNESFEPFTSSGMDGTR